MAGVFKSVNVLFGCVMSVPWVYVDFQVILSVHLVGDWHGWNLREDSTDQQDHDATKSQWDQDFADADWQISVYPHTWDHDQEAFQPDSDENDGGYRNEALSNLLHASGQKECPRHDETQYDDHFGEVGPRVK